MPSAVGDAGGTASGRPGRWTHALDGRRASRPCPPGTYPDRRTGSIPPTEGLAIPIPGLHGEPAAILMLGLNPHRRDDGVAGPGDPGRRRSSGAFATGRADVERSAARTASGPHAAT